MRHQPIDKMASYLAMTQSVFRKKSGQAQPRHDAKRVSRKIGTGSTSPLREAGLRYDILPVD